MDLEVRLMPVSRGKTREKSKTNTEKLKGNHRHYCENKHWGGAVSGKNLEIPIDSFKEKLELYRDISNV